MKLSRHLWRIRRDTRRWFTEQLARFGLAKPYGRCPNCNKGLKITVLHEAEQQTDGSTYLISSMQVKCPKCGYIQPTSTNGQSKESRG